MTTILCRPSIFITRTILPRGDDAGSGCECMLGLTCVAESVSVSAWSCLGVCVSCFIFVSEGVAVLRNEVDKIQESSRWVVSQPSN